MHISFSVAWNPHGSEMCIPEEAALPKEENHGVSTTPIPIVAVLGFQFGSELDAPGRDPSVDTKSSGEI